MLEISGICEKFKFSFFISFFSFVSLEETASSPERPAQGKAAEAHRIASAVQHDAEVQVHTVPVREFIEIFIRKNETSHKFRKFLAFSEFF